MKIIAEPMTMNGPLAALHKAPSFKVVHRTNHPLYNTSAFTRETRDREYLHYQSRPFREPSRTTDNLDGHWHAGMGRSHSEHGLNNRLHRVTDYPVHPKTGLPLENGMVYPRYEDHLGTLPLSAEIRALRRIQSTEQVNQLPPWGGSGRPVQRHQSVREPMMSMVPEESSLLSHLSQMGGPKGQGGTVTKDRVSTTLSQIRTVGTVSVSAEHLNNDAPPPPRQTPVDPQHVYSTLPRTSKGQYSGDNGNPRHGNDPPRVYTNGTLKRKISPGSKSLGSKSGDGIFSRGNSLKQGKMVNKSTSMVGDKSPLSTLTRMPGDGAVVSNEFLATPEEESQQMVEFLPDYSDSEEETFGPPGIGYGLGRKKPNGMATMYRVGSLRQINQKNGKLTEELHRAKSDGLLFDQSDSVTFEDFNPPPANAQSGPNMKQWLQGGVWPHSQSKGSGQDDKQSTLSRYWTMDRSLQRRLQKTNYQHIKRICRDRGQLFEDTDFQPNNRSIYKHKKPPLHPITWLRPHEICQRPRFIAEGATRFDVEQGEQGDPWLLAAVSSLTLTPRFLDRVVPPDQNFEHGYCGVFRFRFWHFGDWVEVLVDDRLPTYKGRLVYMHSTDPSEFWAALLEKAYAKLYGSYEALHQGFTTKALQDLTGGIVQSFSLNSQDKLLTYQVLNSAVPRSTLLIASINIDTRNDSKRTLRLRNGLITRHAYSVTGLARVRGHLGDTHLVRLRNPWGKGEWNGPWSERSWEWDSLSDRDKELLSARVRNEGEFWMAFDDFAAQFSHLDLVHIGPDDWMSESALHSKKPWRAVLARRRWRSGYNAGGAPEHVATTAMNPQFHIQIPRSNSIKCHVVVSVTQQYETNPLDTNGNRKRKKKRKLHHIGFAVYEVPPHMTRLTPVYVSEHEPLDVTNHSVAREVVTFFTLPPGDYIVVPQTNVPNCDGKFLLRILTDEQSNIWEVNEDNMLFRNVLAEFEESFKYTESRHLLGKLVSKYPPEIDASILQKILRSHWKSYLLEKPTLELCKSLVMLRDYNISGRVNLMEIPLLFHMLHFWRNAFTKYITGGHSSKTSSFNLRLILWEAGITVSNKVLECLILRFAKNRLLTSESYMTVMVRLHLAHERFHSIDTKMKGNPLSLEEMILMTIYS